MKTATDPQIAFIRTTMLPVLLMRGDLSEVQIEKSLHSFVSIQADEVKGINENVVLIKEPGLREKFGSFKLNSLIRAFRFPIAKQDKKYQQICKKLDIERVGYERALFEYFLDASTTQDVTRSKKMNARTRELYRSIHMVGDIAKSSDL